MRPASLLPVPWRKALRERKQHPLLDLLPRAITREGLVLRHHVREGRFQRSLALIAAASGVLAGTEVAYEHYRGSYSQRKMWLPVVLTPPLVTAGLWTVASPRPARRLLPALGLAHLATGLLGFAYHLRGIARKPGGFREAWVNVVMGPPPLAPLLFAVPGYLAVVASFLQREDDRRSWKPVRGKLRRELREGRFQRHMAGAAALAGLFSAIEALYSHSKNRYRYWAEWTPLACGGLLAVAGGAAVVSRRAAHRSLPVASALCIADAAIGFGYHVRGVLRRPGGTKNLPYNVLYGPPVFAPLLLGAAGFLGVLTSLLRRER